MPTDEKKIIQEALKKSGSLPAMLEQMARSESEEYRQLRRQVEDGPDHPSAETLYDYGLGWLEEEDTERILDHITLCGSCLEEVLRIRSIEDELNQEALDRADKKPLIVRMKEFVSCLSFPFHLQFPKLVPVRGAEERPPEGPYRIGERMDISLEVPSHGYVVIFHYSGKKEDLDLVFPRSVAKAALLPPGDVPVKGHVSGPVGLHGLKAFWTRHKLLDLQGVNLKNPAEEEALKERFFSLLSESHEEDWQETTREYEVTDE